ncbi:hypothetical protein RRG08_065208 [Elysia crispata]|uniref:Uncharacterized protein n=1 Tax=Elysia crispata TaxID=231223 RepID=A0AAE1E688_9GAST|nr:hypothetical protein RRG08_065208 [Elysia crispata]
MYIFEQEDSSGDIYKFMKDDSSGYIKNIIDKFQFEDSSGNIYKFQKKVSRSISMALLFNSLVVILFPVLISGFSYETAQQKCTAVQVNTTTTVNQTVDNSFDDPFVRLMRASSIEEALALNILYKDNHIATAADLNSAYDPSSGKLLVKRRKFEDRIV